MYFFSRPQSSAAALFSKTTLFGLLCISLFFTGCPSSKKAMQTPSSDPIEPVVTRESEPEVPIYKPPVDETRSTGASETSGNLPFTLQNIYFEFDRYDLTPEALQTLADNARVLKAHPEARIVIEGHCDERGTVEYNLALGDKRAKAARDYMISLGVNAAQILTISYGKERPLDPSQTENAWAKNRRAEFAKR